MASEIVLVAGAQLVGSLPGDFKMVIVFAAGVGSASKDPTAANALIQFITGPTGAEVLKSKGMDPA